MDGEAFWNVIRPFNSNNTAHVDIRPRFEAETFCSRPRSSRRLILAGMAEVFRGTLQQVRGGHDAIHFSRKQSRAVLPRPRKSNSQQMRRPYDTVSTRNKILQLCDSPKARQTRPEIRKRNHDARRTKSHLRALIEGYSLALFRGERPRRPQGRSNTYRRKRRKLPHKFALG